MTEAVRAPRRSIPNPLAGMEERRRQTVILVLVVVLALVYPLIYRPLSNAIPALPWPGTAVLVVCATFAILALGLNIVMGFAGLLDLGYVAFYAIGAYTTAFLGGAVILGPNANLTGGNVGINPIDPPIIPIPGPWGASIVFSNQNVIASWYLVLALLAITFFICRRLRDSKLGREWMAIREDETAAAAMGINTVTTKLLAFSLGASFSGFAGAFTGAYNTAIFAETFSYNVSILVVIIIILGGIGSLRGVVIGAFALLYVDRALLPWLGDNIVNDPMHNRGVATGQQILADFKLTTYNYRLFGIVLVIMMIRRPEGLFPDA